MSELFLSPRRQVDRIKPYFLVSHDVPGVDDVRVIRYGLQWKDAPKAYGPHETL